MLPHKFTRWESNKYNSKRGWYVFLLIPIYIELCEALIHRSLSKLKCFMEDSYNFHENIEMFTIISALMCNVYYLFLGGVQFSIIGSHAYCSSWYYMCISIVIQSSLTFITIFWFLEIVWPKLWICRFLFIGCIS